MLTFFNRQELTVTFSLQEMSRIQNILAGNGLEYKVKTFLKHGIDRARMGSMGMNPDEMYEYIIYVRKDDYDVAMHLIHAGRED